MTSRTARPSTRLILGVDAHNASEVGKREKTSSIDARPTNECHRSAFRSAKRNVSQFYDDAIAGSGLRITQYSILNRVFENGALTMNELAELLVMDRTTSATFPDEPL